MFINLFSLLNVFYSYENIFEGFLEKKIPEFFALLGEWGVFAEGIVIPQKKSRLTSASKKKWMWNIFMILVWCYFLSRGVATVAQFCIYAPGPFIFSIGLEVRLR